MAVKKGEEITLPDHDYVYNKNEHLMVLGKEEDVMRIIED